jgi:hypothetical protein
VLLKLAVAARRYEGMVAQAAAVFTSNNCCHFDNNPPTSRKMSQPLTESTAFDVLPIITL